MFNLVSILIGILALILEILVIIPLVGALVAWVVLVLGIIGFILGAISRKNGGRNLNIIVLIIAIIRLVIGGGWL